MSDLTLTIEGLDKSHTRYRRTLDDGKVTIIIYQLNAPIVRRFNKDGKYVGGR